MATGQFRRAVEINRDRRFACDARGNQPPSHAIRARNQFAIGDGLIFEADRDGVRRSRRLQIDQFVNGEFRDRKIRPREGRVERVLLRLRQDRQPQGFPVHVVGDGFEQRPVMADPARDRRQRRTNPCCNRNRR